MTKSLLYGAGATLLAFLVGACSHSAPPAPPPPPEVGVITVQPRTVPLTRNLVGRLSPFRSADVRARVAGVVLKRDYKEGSEVKAGQLLFEIDPAPLKAALANAQAQLAQAQATYANDRFNAEQARKLAPKGYISRTDLGNALAAERTARAAVQGAKAMVETAKINLGYASVTSPIAGRAGEAQVTEGALVGQGTDTLLTTVDQIDPLYVNFTISISELNDLRQTAHSGGIQLSGPGKTTIKVSLPDGTPYPETGTVDFSAPTVDPATGSVNLRAVLPNPRFILLPGSYVNLQVTLGERHDSFLIPQEAVQRDTSGTYVLTVGKDGKVAREDVKTAGMHGLDWVVTSGLAAGDQVIVSGVPAAQIGKPVRTEAWQPPASAHSARAASAAATASSAPADAANRD